MQVTAPVVRRFSKDYRLLTPAEYARVIGSGRQIRVCSLRLNVAQNGLTHPRLGLAVSKRFLRKAVERNLLKRLARETFRHCCHSLGPLDIVVRFYAVPDSLPTRGRHQWSALLKGAFLRLER